jgi:hypothetical protein
MPLDNSDVTAPLRALGAVGDAVMRAGSVVGAVAAKRQEATDRRLVNQAQASMDQAAIEFRSWQEANPNAPEKWTEEAKRRAEGLVKPFLGMKELSQAAKDDLQLMGQSWQTRFVGGVEASSTRAIFGLAKTSYVGRARRAFELGDVEGGRTALTEAEGGGYIHSFEREALEFEGTQRAKAKRKGEAEMTADTFIMRGQPEQARKVLEDNKDAFEPAEFENKTANVEERAMKSKEYNDLMVIANDDPASAAQLAIEKERDGKIDAAMRVDVVRKSEGVLASNRRQGAAEYAERIETPGMMPSEAEITMDSRLNDYDREQLRRRIKGATFDQATEFEGALSKVMSFSPSAFENKADAITAATNLEASIDATFSGPYASRLKEELGKRQQMTAPGATSATDIGPAMATLDEAIEAGGLGPIRKPVMQDGKPVMRDPKKEGFTQDMKEGYKFNPWEMLPFGFLGSSNEKTMKPSGKPVEVLENKGQPVPIEEKDPVAEAKARAIQKEIRETVEAEIKAGKLTDQPSILQRAGELYISKGGKLKPKPKAEPVTGYRPVQIPAGQSFGVTTKTREELGASTTEARQVSLDFNDAASSTARGIEIIIPDDATEQERAAAQAYVTRTQEFFKRNGVTVPVRGVKTRTENGRGTVGRFHTEPFFVGDAEAVAAMQKDPAGYAEVLASTLGTIPGVTFIAPHKANDPGAGRGGLNERDFARSQIIPQLERLRKKSGTSVAVTDDINQFIDSYGN